MSNVYWMMFGPSKSRPFLKFIFSRPVLSASRQPCLHDSRRPAGLPKPSRPLRNDQRWQISLRKCRANWNLTCEIGNSELILTTNTPLISESRWIPTPSRKFTNLLLFWILPKQSLQNHPSSITKAARVPVSLPAALVSGRSSAVFDPNLAAIAPHRATPGLGAARGRRHVRYGAAPWSAGPSWGLKGPELVWESGS